MCSRRMRKVRCARSGVVLYEPLPNGQRSVTGTSRYGSRPGAAHSRSTCRADHSVEVDPGTCVPIEDSVVMDTEPEQSTTMFRLGDRKAMKTRALPGECS